MSKYNLLIIIFLMSGCANYINNMHKEFDNFEGKNNRTLQSTPGLETFAEGDKRYIADDFKDKSNNSSLWVGNGKENFFSTGGVRKEKGDLVTINVYTKLKDQISGELSRFYPSENSSSDTTKNKPEKKPTAPSDSSSEIQDKVSVVVTKEVRDNHLILIGRKQIIYNENRHLVEVQALVHRKDITTDDTLNSNKIIQSTIKVLR